MRFIPYPVIGGFLAGTGWLMVQGGLSVMTDAQLSSEWISFLLQPSVLLRWFPGVGLALVFLIVKRVYPLVESTLAILLLAIVIFYGVIYVSGFSVEQSFLCECHSRDGTRGP